MKRKLLFLMLCIASMLGMKAQSPASFTDGERYVFYNIGSGKYLGPSNSWGTQASLIESSHFNTVHYISDGVYTLESQVSNGGSNYYFNGSYMDGAATNVTINALGDGVFTMSNGTTYYGYDGSSTVLASNLADPTSNNAKWKIIHYDDVYDDASSASPADLTYRILDANFGRNNRYGGGDNNDLGNQWTMTASNYKLSGGDNTNCCAESYHSTFTLSQTLTVPNGVYEMRAQGFYRQDGSDNTNLPVFYINGKTKTFPIRQHSEGNMDDASASFSAGEYTIDPIRVLVTNNRITLGAKLETNTDLWCIFDNFTLSYLGEPSTSNPIDFTDAPIDMTSFIANPDVETDGDVAGNGTVTGWSCNTGADNHGTLNGQTGVFTGHAFENWKNGALDGKMYQTLAGLPDGVYKFDLAAMVRNVRNQFIYGKSNDLSFRKYLSGADGTAAAYSVYAMVSGGNMEIGLDINNSSIDWAAIDNAALTYYGTSAEAYALVHSQESTLFANMLDAMTNSTIKTYLNSVYASYSSPTATVSDYTTAINTFTPNSNNSVELIEASQLSARASLMKDVARTETSSGSNNTFSTAVTTHYTNVLIGSNSSTAITLANTALRTAMSTYVNAARPTSGNSFDVTEFITSPSFESMPPLTGWTNDGPTNLALQGNSSFTSKAGIYYVEAWEPGASSNFDLHQTISGLPAGYYTLTAKALSRDVNNVKLYISNGTETTETAVTTENTYSASVYLTASGSITIGIKGTGTGISASWVCADNFTLTYEYYATSAEYTALNTAVNTAKTTYYNHLGFDNGEYAPYNNVGAVTAVEAAETLLSNGSKYNVTTTTASLPGLSWTANVGEVNAIYNGDFAIAAHDGAGNPQPTGWAKTKGTYTGDGYNVRYRTSSESAGMAYLSTGKGLFTKMNAYYGWETGYTMPLKANTYYKITFSVGGMEDCDDLTDYVKITNPSETTTTIATFTVPNKTANTDATSTSWLDVTAYFKTDAAGDYVLGLVPRNSGGKTQNQFGYGDFNLVRATTAEMVTEYATGQMNATVKENLVNAQTAYSSSATDANYTAFVTALEAAKASVEVYEAINTRITALQAAAQRGDIPAGSMSSMAFVTKYNDGEVNGVADATTGTYSSLDEVLTQYKSNVSSYWSDNHPDVGTDMTAFIINQGFELDGTGTDDPTGWTNTNKGNVGQTHTQNSPSVTNMSGYYYNIWQNWWDAFIDLKQNITDMPIGKYTLTATLAGWETDSTPVTLSANGETEDITNAGDATGVEVSVDCFSLHGNVDIKVNGGLRGDTPGPAGTFFKADNFRLTYQGIKPLLADLISKAESRRDADGNVGGGVFQTPTLQKTNLEKAITRAQAMYENGSATFDQVFYAIMDLNSVYIAFETNVNAPANGKKYYLKVTTDDHAKENNYVATKLQDDEISANNLTGYTFNASITSASPYKAQAFKFTKSEEDAAFNYEYYISIERPEGEVWLTYGSLNGSAAGWATQQIQGTTDISKRGVFYIEPTSTLNKFHIRNSAYGKEIICQNAGNLYTEETPSGSDGLEFSVVEATTANVTVSCKSGKYGTVIFPFTPNIAGDSDFDNIDFYTCNRVDGETAKVSGVAKGSLQAQIPYLIYNRGGSDFTKTVSDYGIVTEEDDADGDADADTYGLLTGTYTAQAVPVSDGSTNYYVLQTKPTTGQAFYKVTSAFTSTAYKAYMTVESGGSPVKAFFLGFDELDGINNIEFEEEEKDGTVIYNLAGQRVANTQKGIYIKNGKKVVVR